MLESTRFVVEWELPGWPGEWNRKATCTSMCLAEREASASKAYRPDAAVRIVEEHRKVVKEL